MNINNQNSHSANLSPPLKEEEIQNAIAEQLTNQLAERLKGTHSGLTVKTQIEMQGDKPTHFNIILDDPEKNGSPLSLRLHFAHSVKMENFLTFDFEQQQNTITNWIEIAVKVHQVAQNVSNPASKQAYKMGAEDASLPFAADQLHGARFTLDEKTTDSKRLKHTGLKVAPRNESTFKALYVYEHTISKSSQSARTSSLLKPTRVPDPNPIQIAGSNKLFDHSDGSTIYDPNGHNPLRSRSSRSSIGESTTSKLEKLTTSRSRPRTPSEEISDALKVLSEQKIFPKVRKNLVEELQSNLKKKDKTADALAHEHNQLVDKLLKEYQDSKRAEENNENKFNKNNKTPLKKFQGKLPDQPDQKVIEGVLDALATLAKYQAISSEQNLVFKDRTKQVFNEPADITFYRPNEKAAALNSSNITPLTIQSWHSTLQTFKDSLNGQFDKDKESLAKFLPLRTKEATQPGKELEIKDINDAENLRQSLNEGFDKALKYLKDKPISESPKKARSRKDVLEVMNLLKDPLINYRNLLLAIHKKNIDPENSGKVTVKEEDILNDPYFVPNFNEISERDKDFHYSDAVLSWLTDADYIHNDQAYGNIGIGEYLDNRLKKGNMEKFDYQMFHILTGGDSISDFAYSLDNRYGKNVTSLVQEYQQRISNSQEPSAELLSSK